MKKALTEIKQNETRRGDIEKSGATFPVLEPPLSLVQKSGAIEESFDPLYII